MDSYDSEKEEIGFKMLGYLRRINRLRSEQPKDRGSILDRCKISPQLHTGSGAHSASYPMGIRGSCAGVDGRSEK
jgi:hypothetical protein